METDLALVLAIHNWSKLNIPVPDCMYHFTSGYMDGGVAGDEVSDPVFVGGHR